MLKLSVGLSREQASSCLCAAAALQHCPLLLIAALLRASAGSGLTVQVLETFSVVGRLCELVDAADWRDLCTDMAIFGSLIEVASEFVAIKIMDKVLRRQGALCAEALSAHGLYTTRKSSFPHAHLLCIDSPVVGFEPFLHFGARRGLVGVVAAALERGADPNKPIIGGQTPLHVAAAAGKHETVQLLLAVDEVDPTILNAEGYGLLTAGACSNRVAPIHVAMHAGSVDGFLTSSRKDFCWNQRTSDGTPPLIISADNELLLLKLVASRRFDLSAADSDGRQVAHVAAAAGHNLLKLSEEGVCFDVLDANGLRPVHYAARARRNDNTMFLLRSRCDVERFGESYLLDLISNQEFEVLCALCERQVLSPRFPSLLPAAVASGASSAVRRLLRAGAASATGLLTTSAGCQTEPLNLSD